MANEMATDGRKGLKETLMALHGWSEDEADREIEYAKGIWHGYIENGDIDAAYNVMEEYFGLEPDYLDEWIEELV